MAKYETVINKNFDQMVSYLDKEISRSGVSMKLVDESNYILGGVPIAVRVYDKFYARNSNRTSLSVSMIGHEDKVYISAIGSGGGQGIFFNFSFGAEDDMVDIVKEIIEKME